MDTKWQIDWPTEPGWYWGFGKYRGSRQVTRLEAVQVVTIANGLAYVSHGTFLYPKEWVGMFVPMVLPSKLPPTDAIDALESLTTKGRS